MREPKRWAVILDGPIPTGRHFDLEEKAQAWAVKQRRRGMRAVIVDLAELTPELIEEMTDHG